MSIEITGVSQRIARNGIERKGTGRAELAAKARLDKIMGFLPIMITLSSNVDIMLTSVPRGLFREAMKGQWFTGNNAGVLRDKLANKTAGKAHLPLNYVSLFDGREFAKQLSTLTGRKFRVLTESEWEQAGDSICPSGWVWTETKQGESYVIRSQAGGSGHSREFPDRRDPNISLILVEDK